MTNLRVYAPTADYKLDPRLEHFRDCKYHKTKLQSYLSIKRN